MILHQIFNSGNDQNNVKLRFVGDGDLLTKVTYKFHRGFNLIELVKGGFTLTNQNPAKRI